MAIAHVVSGNSSGGSFTLASSGSDRYLIAFTYGASSITYNGVSLTKIHTYVPSFPSGTNCPPIEVWALNNPDTGTNTLAPTGADFVVASIYSGVSPGSVEATNDQDSANVQNGSWSGSVTTITQNAWRVMCVKCSNTSNDFTAGSSTTKRTSHTGVSSSSIGLFDSNGPIASPGSGSLNASLTSGSGFMTSVTISMSPVFESTGSFLQYF